MFYKLIIQTLLIGFHEYTPKKLEMEEPTETSFICLIS